MTSTHDIVQILDLANAPTKLSNLIEKLATNLPDTAILISQHTHLEDATGQAIRNAFNTALSGLISTRTNASQHTLDADRH
jgi:uncharacterized protein YejL (UPF0352 family)